MRVYPLIQVAPKSLTAACKQTLSQTELNGPTCKSWFVLDLRRFRPPCGLLAAPRAPSQTHVCLRMAARAAQQSPAVRQGGGLHHLDNEHRPRAAKFPPESSTHDGPAREGEVTCFARVFRSCGLI